MPKPRLSTHHHSSCHHHRRNATHRIRGSARRRVRVDRVETTTTKERNDDAVSIERVVMETVARVVAGGITRSLSDANGGGAARGGADVGNQVRIRTTTTRRSRCSDSNARAGFYPLIFFSFSLAVRSFVRRRTTTTTTSSARSVVDAARRPRAAARLFGADLFGVSLTHRPFVIRRFKLKIQNRTPLRRPTKRRFPRTREPYRSVFIARRRRRTTNENNDGCVNNLRVHAFATRDASSSSSSSFVARCSTG